MYGRKFVGMGPNLSMFFTHIFQICRYTDCFVLFSVLRVFCSILDVRIDLLLDYEYNG